MLSETISAAPSAQDDVEAAAEEHYRGEREHELQVFEARAHDLSLVPRRVIAARLLKITALTDFSRVLSASVRDLPTLSIY